MGLVIAGTAFPAATLPRTDHEAARSLLAVGFLSLLSIPTADHSELVGPETLTVATCVARFLRAQRSQFSWDKRQTARRHGTLHAVSFVDACKQTTT